MTDEPFDYSQLDPGIVETVQKLRLHGFETTDSGDGSKTHMTCALPFKNVTALCPKFSMVEESHRMAAVLGPDWRVDVSYCPHDERAVLFAYERAEHDRLMQAHTKEV